MEKVRKTLWGLEEFWTTGRVNFEKCEETKGHLGYIGQLRRLEENNYDKGANPGFPEGVERFKVYLFPI